VFDLLITFYRFFRLSRRICEAVITRCSVFKEQSFFFRPGVFFGRNKNIPRIILVLQVFFKINLLFSTYHDALLRFRRVKVLLLCNRQILLGTMMKRSDSESGVIGVMVPLPS